MPDTCDAKTLWRLLETLSLEQKVRLLTGADFWTTHAEPAIGLRRMVFSDGPSGVRGQTWDERDPSLNLPSATALAASWDPSLAYRYGAALAAEARRKGVHVVLGPTVNLHRSPLGGRHFEAFSEDPLLTSDLAAAYVRGLQDHGVAATPKHYVANDYETERFTANTVVDERTLRELYLAPFETAVVEGGAWAVMSAYNAVQGVTMTENRLLETPLCTEWGFDGVVVSDWAAVRSTEPSARARQDLVMPGPDGPWGPALVAAVRAGHVPEKTIDEKVLRLLRLAARIGALDGAGPRAAPEPLAAGPAFAREVAAAGTVLLRNTGELPWRAPGPASIALIGEHAMVARTQGGGSATVQPTGVVSPADGLRAAFPRTPIACHPGVPVHRGITTLPLDALTDPVTGDPGMRVRYLSADGHELLAETRRATQLVWLGTLPAAAATVQLCTRYRPDSTGSIRLGVAAVGGLSVHLDGTPVLGTELVADGTNLGAALFEPPTATAPVETTAGQSIGITVDYTVPESARSRGTAALTLGTEAAERSSADAIATAVAAARAAEVAVVVVGTSPETESEGFDRTTLALPGAQDDLVRAVAAANPRTIVVVNAGSPVLMPWRDQVAAILLTWFGGQETGHALADVLRGRTEPGGRLPTTWPAEQDDVPVVEVTPVNGSLHYAEGVDIGYRAWLRAGTAAAYPFGHGLGYTTWELADLTVHDHAEVRVTVRNTGNRPGKQVIQAYLSREQSAVQRPVRWLAAFAIVRADPGTAQQVRLTLPARAFAHWDAGWHTEPGSYRVEVGTNADDLPLAAQITATIRG